MRWCVKVGRLPDQAIHAIKSSLLDDTKRVVVDQIIHDSCSTHRGSSKRQVLLCACDCVYQKSCDVLLPSASS